MQATTRQQLAERARRRIETDFADNDELVRYALGEEGIPVPISPREIEVMVLLGKGMNTKEIAKKLHLSLKTAEKHRENIKRKLDLKDAFDLLYLSVLCSLSGIFEKNNERP